MFGFQYIKATPSQFIMHYRGGKLRRSGTGLAFFYFKPSSSIVVVPIGSADVPFIFNEIKHFMATGEHRPPPSVADRVEAAREHLRASLVWKGPWEGVVEMRRHYGNYLKGLPNVKEVRLRLCTERDPTVLEAILDEVKGMYAEVMAG